MRVMRNVGIYGQDNTEDTTLWRYECAALKMVRTLLYWIWDPSCSVTLLLGASMPVMEVLYCCLSAGSIAATFFQMPPVPPSWGKRNTALGPQPLSVLFLC